MSSHSSPSAADHDKPSIRLELLHHHSSDEEQYKSPGKEGEETQEARKVLAALPSSPSQTKDVAAARNRMEELFLQWISTEETRDLIRCMIDDLKQNKSIEIPTLSLSSSRTSLVSPRSTGSAPGKHTGSSKPPPVSPGKGTTNKQHLGEGATSPDHFTFPGGKFSRLRDIMPKSALLVYNVCDVIAIHYPANLINPTDEHATDQAPQAEGVAEKWPGSVAATASKTGMAHHSPPSNSLSPGQSGTPRGHGPTIRSAAHETPPDAKRTSSKVICKAIFFPYTKFSIDFPYHFRKFHVFTTLAKVAVDEEDPC